jgi:hypothetical protein
MYDYIELRLLIIRKFDNVAKFCESTGINYQALNHTMKTGKAMSVSSIERLAKVLEIPEEEYGKYFFAKKAVNINAD